MYMIQKLKWNKNILLTNWICRRFLKYTTIIFYCSLNHLLSLGREPSHSFEQPESLLPKDFLGQVRLKLTNCSREKVKMWRKKLQILTVVTWVTFPWCWRPPFARYCTQSCSKLLSQSLWLLDLSLPSDGLPPVHTLRWNWFINDTGRWFSTGFTKRLDILKSYI